MSEEEPSHKKDFVRYFLIAMAFFALTMIDHPVVNSFYILNLAFFFYCLYRAGRAGRALWRK